MPRRPRAENQSPRAHQRVVRSTCRGSTGVAPGGDAVLGVHLSQPSSSACGRQADSCCSPLKASLHFCRPCFTPWLEGRQAPLCGPMWGVGSPWPSSPSSTWAWSDRAQPRPSVPPNCSNAAPASPHLVREEPRHDPRPECHQAADRRLSHRALVAIRPSVVQLDLRPSTEPTNARPGRARERQDRAPVTSRLSSRPSGFARARAAERRGLRR